MSGRNLDPDAYIRSQVQRIVDRFELDPRETSRAMARTSGIGYVGGVLVLGWMAAGLMAELGEPAWKAWVLPVMPLLAYAVQVHQIVIPQVFSMSPIAAAQRMMWILISCMMVTMLALMPAATPLAVRLSFFAVAIGWTGGVASIYVHLCRKPPRRPRREKVARRSLAKA